MTDEFPFQAVVRACNGSGKDKYVIAPCAVWLCMRYTQARCVITSASGDQLDNQTDAYIYQLCHAANRKIAPNIWKLNYRYYECLATQSPMKLFATDEAGKAEGYHPLGHGKKMAIFMSEAKSVPNEINVAINKCTGYTHRVHVSTPGSNIGHFYDYCQPTNSVMRSDIKDVYAKMGNLSTLQTTTKSSLVGAINEIKSSGSLQINDSTPSASTTFSGTAIDSKIATAKTEVKNEILGSASAAYDTLQEIQAQMEVDDTAASALTTAVGQRPTYTETGNLDTDLVQLYNTAKA